MNDTNEHRSAINPRPRHRRVTVRHRKVATLNATLATLAAALSLFCSCRVTTPTLGLGYNTSTGMFGITIGQITIGQDSKETNSTTTLTGAPDLK